MVVHCDAPNRLWGHTGFCSTDNLISALSPRLWKDRITGGQIATQLNVSQPERSFESTDWLSILLVNCDNGFPSRRINGLHHPPVICISIKIELTVRSDLVHLFVVRIRVCSPIVGMQTATRRNVTESEVVSIFKVLDPRRDFLGFVFVQICADDDPVSVQVRVSVASHLLLP